MTDPQDTAAFHAPEPEQLAPLFPGYDIECLIATGGMGAVYRAVQRSLDRTVAIKILPRELSSDAAFRTGFEAEAKAMARLNHPNLIGVYDFGEVEGMLYIIMEFVPGKSLFHSADGIAIDPAEVIRIVSGICDGLAHAHEHGILHRDIKPSNILLDLSARPKIGDFGLARPFDATVRDGDEIFGTPHYTAPEVVNAPQTVDSRADIFSVGVMLHELLTGQLPAHDPRPASIMVHCDPQFDAIIRRATNPVPELRYASAAEISKELRSIHASTGPGVPYSTVPPGPPRPAPRTTRRIAPAKKSSGITGILMLLASIGILFFSYQHYLKRKAARIVIVEKSPAPAPADGIREPSLSAAPSEPAPPEITEPDPPPDADSEAPAASEVPQAAPVETTSSVTPRTPKFDIPGFFERAKGIMKVRAAPLIATRDKNLAQNLALFERDAKLVTRKIKSRDAREAAEKQLDAFIGECGSDENRLSEDVPFALSEVPEILDLHNSFLAKQGAFEASLMQSLFQLSSTYILGLQKQIERLEGTDDPAAIDLIEDEIARTRSDGEYFPELMLSSDP